MVTITDIPLPPTELRDLIGKGAIFDGITDLDILEEHGPAIWRSVLDFGCGSGRLARHLLRHDPVPRRYVGIDIDRRGLAWCAEHLYPIASRLGLRWDFVHHDVRNPFLNPTGAAEVLSLPMLDRTVSLVLAHSVFTHLIERQALQYLHEVGRVLTADGLAYTTWYLTDRDACPLPGGVNALYASPDDPSAGVVYERGWLRETARAAGLRIVHVGLPGARHYQWRVLLAREGTGLAEADWPPLDATEVYE
jgi:SAM-dependent methyltransferase